MTRLDGWSSRSHIGVRARDCCSVCVSGVGPDGPRLIVVGREVRIPRVAGHLD